MTIYGQEQDVAKITGDVIGVPKPTEYPSWLMGKDADNNSGVPTYYVIATQELVDTVMSYLAATFVSLEYIGEDVFTTTAVTDSVVITGALSTDTYFITGQFTSAIDQQDILQWQAINDTLVVHRMADGESALKYSWLRIPTP